MAKSACRRSWAVLLSVSYPDRRDDILTQLSAVSTAIDSLAFQILDEHVKHCVAGALAAGDEADAQAKAEELLAAVHRFAKAR